MVDPTLNCEGTPLYETQYDPSNPDTLTRSIVEAVATVAETLPTELAPLHEAIDLDALERFVEHASDASRDTAVSIWFSVETWTVRVHTDGRVLVREPAEEAAEYDDAATRTRDADGSN